MERQHTGRRQRIVVIATDAVTEGGAQAVLHAHPALLLLPSRAVASADAMLVLAAELDEHVVDLMRSATATRERPPRTVLVTEQATPTALAQAVSLGVADILLRSRTGYEQIIEALLRSAPPDTAPPEAVARMLLTQLREQHRRPAAPRADQAPLDERERRVLRLLADGLSTRDIAQQLSYSERTIKMIIQGSCTRLGLRNRTHAVAHALRHGMI